MSTNDSQAPKADTISLDDEEGVKQVLVNSVLGLWDVVNNLTRLKPSKHDRYRVTIFGSARVRAGTFAYEETKRVAAGLAEMGCDIITGGGPGLMQAANEGAATRRVAPNPSAFASTCHSSRKSTRSSPRRSSTGRFSPACISSCLRRTRSSSRQGASAPCWRR
jgi:hypothetical protein